MFSTHVYQQRRAMLASQFQAGILLFLGNEESGMNYAGNTYPFRQDSSFLYYFGLDQPQLAAVVDADTGKEIIFGNEWTMEDIVWMGEHTSLRAMAEAVGISDVRAYGELANYLKNKQVHYLPPYRPENAIKLHQWLGLGLDEIGKGASEQFIKAVVAQRSCKQAVEIAEMERALQTTAAMHEAVMRGANQGTTEASLAAEAHRIALEAGGGLAYPIILSVNGQVLHNHLHNNILQKGQLLLGDFGADTAMHYAGDITRSTPVDRRFTTQQKEIYNIVLQSQLRAIEAMQPGRSYKDIHLLAAKTIGEGMKSLGLMQGDMDEAVAEGATALFFPHGLGHAIGLDVHDMEDLGEKYVGYDASVERSAQFGLAYLRFARPLQEGFVLTVEPGIYFIPQLIDQWRAERRHERFIRYDRLAPYRSFGGIRIEDNVLVTATGHRVLGPRIPKTIEEVEAF
jgi:Xaa-Pro aminopeptidase